MPTHTPPEADAPAVAQRIVVPIANPATAEGLLRLALSLVVGSGRVIAAYVTVQGAEPRLDVHEQLEAIVARLQEKGGPVEFVTDLATSIARGILDVAQERHANLIVLGIRGLQRGKVVLGSVVDAVARTAPCNVLVYRGIHSLYGGEGYQHVIVPVDGSSNSRMAARIGLRFASHIDSPMTAIYVQQDASMKRYQALARIEASLEGLESDEAANIRKLVVHANDVVTGILSRAQEEHLIVLGFSEQSSLDRWLFGDIAQRMLSSAPGPLILVKQAVGETMPAQLEHRIANLLPTLTPTEEAEVAALAQEMAKPSTNFSVLVILSCLIAALGLVQNSAAVIIGAMLIAPLMSPLMGFAVGLTQGRPEMMREAVLTMARGVLLALGLSFLSGVLMPTDAPTSEMLARSQPSLVDMGIALFSGAAGAYAMARKDIPSALAGVAIAAALMPPLCTVGLALAYMNWELASGAFLLFLTNIVSISLAGAAVFLWLGMRLRAGADDAARYRWRVLLSLVVLVVLSLPLASTVQHSITTTARLDTVRHTLESELGGVVDSVEIHGGDVTSITATVRLTDDLTPHEVQRVQDAVAANLNRPVELELVVWRIIRPPGDG
ncbi:MAG: TIGR00341 family protein [Anaerolineae bacterium]|nr:TIGR00341 family protein [Anaerolineae bacterium]